MSSQHSNSPNAALTKRISLRRRNSQISYRNVVLKHIIEKRNINVILLVQHAHTYHNIIIVKNRSNESLIVVYKRRENVIDRVTYSNIQIDIHIEILQYY